MSRNICQLVGSSEVGYRVTPRFFIEACLVVHPPNLGSSFSPREKASLTSIAPFSDHSDKTQNHKQQKLRDTAAADVQINMDCISLIISREVI